MTDLTLQAVRVEPRDARFASALDARGARRWADPAFPYELAGAGTAAMGAASAPEDLGEEPSGDGQPASSSEAPVAGACFVLDGAEPGAIGVIVRPGYLRGEVVPVALLRDLAPPAAQGGRQALVAAAVGFAREAGAVAAVAGAPGTDPPVAGMEAGWGGVPAFSRVAEFRAVRVIPALWRMEEPEYKVLGATKTEVPALAYMLDAYRRGLAFAAPVDEAAFLAGVERCPGFKISDFRIARYKGELVAMAGVWEPGAALPVAQDASGPAEALMALAGKVLGRLSPSPRLPGPGRPMRVRFVRSFAIKQGHPTVLKYLLDRSANEARKLGAHAFEIVLSAGDELLPCVRGRVRRVRICGVWAAALQAGLDLADLGPVDAGILDPGQ